MIRPIAIALVGALAGAGLAFGFQTLRPPAVDVSATAEEDEEFAGMTGCEQVEAINGTITALKAELDAGEADLASLKSRAAEVVGEAVEWPADKAGSIAESTRASLTSSLERFGGTLLVLDCSEDPCIHASLFQGPDADADGFVADGPAQGHVRLTTLSGNNAENVPHKLLVRTIAGPEAADGEHAKRIGFRMQQIFPAAVQKITFEPIDPAKPALGWKIAEDEPAADEGDAPAPEGDAPAPEGDGGE